MAVTDLTRLGSWSQREERAEEELTIRLWAGLVWHESPGERELDPDQEHLRHTSDE